MDTATLICSAIAAVGVVAQILLQLRRWHVDDNRADTAAQTLFSIRLVRYGKRRERWQLAVRNDGRTPFQLNGAALRPSGRRLFWRDGDAERTIVRMVEERAIERFAPIVVQRTAHQHRVEPDTALRLWTAHGLFEVPLADAREEYAPARSVRAERPERRTEPRIESGVAEIKIPSGDQRPMPPRAAPLRQDASE